MYWTSGSSLTTCAQNAGDMVMSTRSSFAASIRVTAPMIQHICVSSSNFFITPRSMRSPSATGMRACLPFDTSLSCKHIKGAFLLPFLSATRSAYPDAMSAPPSSHTHGRPVPFARTPSMIHSLGTSFSGFLPKISSRNLRSPLLEIGLTSPILVMSISTSLSTILILDTDFGDFFAGSVVGAASTATTGVST